SLPTTARLAGFSPRPVASTRLRTFATRPSRWPATHGRRRTDDGPDPLRAPRPFPTAHGGGGGPPEGPIGRYCTACSGGGVRVLLGPVAVGVDVAQGEFHMLIDFIIDSIRSVLLEDADAISRHRSSCHLPRPGHSFHSFRSRDGDNDATEQHGRQIAFKPN